MLNIISKNIRFNKKDKLKTINKFILISLLSMLAWGCEDVIEVDLNSTNSSIVIEGSIADYNSPGRVIITKSTDFYKSGVYEKISGASIIINDNTGNIFNLIEVTEGIYETDINIGKSNTEYFIEVIAEGKNYNASSIMPSKMVLDSLTLEKAPAKPGGDDGLGRYYLHLYFNDPPNINNYCRIKLFNNNVQLGGFNVYSDKLTDGNLIDYRIILDMEEKEIELGDTISVQLMSIDKSAYDFYLTANNVNASGTSDRSGHSSISVTPANPISNWSNNALGLFSAYTVSIKSIVFTK